MTRDTEKNPTTVNFFVKKLVMSQFCIQGVVCSVFAALHGVGPGRGARERERKECRHLHFSPTNREREKPTHLIFIAVWAWNVGKVGPPVILFSFIFWT